MEENPAVSHGKHSLHNAVRATSTGGVGRGADAHLANGCLDQHQRPRVHPHLLKGLSARMLTAVPHISRRGCPEHAQARAPPL